MFCWSRVFRATREVDLDLRKEQIFWRDGVISVKNLDFV